MNTPTLNKPGRAKRVTAQFVLVVLVIIVIFGLGNIVIKQNSDTVNNYNTQLIGTAKTSTVYLASSYSLYGSPLTIKFQNIIGDYMSENNEVSKVAIFDTDGRIVFDSSQTSSANLGQVNFAILSDSQKDKVQASSSGNRIKYIVSPYFEEWSSHKYTVLFYPSYDQIDQQLWQFNLGIGLIAILIFAVITAVAISITLFERYKVREEEREKLEAIDKLRQEFIMLVAHNLRTPVTVIQGYVSMLTDTDVSSEQHKMIDLVTSSVRDLHNLIEQMLTITSVLGHEDLTVEKQQFRLKEVIDKIIETYQNETSEKQLAVEQSFETDSIEVYSNQRYVEMILTYLFENAAKFNKPQGKITVKEYAKEADIVVEIADTGNGIGNKEQENLFAGFHKSDGRKSLYNYSSSGIGLGLYTTKILIELLGGKIWFESTEGTGSTFYVSLPTGQPTEKTNYV